MTLNCNGQLIDVSTPKVMGIVNLTPDSFYDGGKHQNEAAVLRLVEKMLFDGATFIDVGAYSSRPGAQDISINEEEKRLLPMLELILRHFPNTLVSVDTFRSEVAKKAINTGACMVNDISAGSLDENMMPVVAQLQVPYVMMHMKGSPQTMQQMANYNNITNEVLYYFSEKMAIARSLGINDILADPGFGFAKTVAHNYELLNNLERFCELGVPLLVGISRKSMIYKILESSPAEALNGTTALNTVALLKGANILRVHDVKEAVECVKLLKNLQPY